MQYIKKLFIATVILGIIVFVGTFMVSKLVTVKAKNQIYNSVSDIPHNKVGLLLGTSKYAYSGNINLYYQYRINAAVELFNAGKIDFILVSGDNSTMSYDEPTTFKKDLIARGIPEDKIHLDYAGFRTLDSVVRSKAVFGQEAITIISQQFHNERALFLANRKGIKAVAFNAQDVNSSYGFKTLQREKLARVKMILDLMQGKKPKFLGDKIEIE